MIFSLGDIKGGALLPTLSPPLAVQNALQSWSRGHNLGGQGH